MERKELTILPAYPWDNIPMDRRVLFYISGESRGRYFFLFYQDNLLCCIVLLLSTQETLVLHCIMQYVYGYM